MKDKTWLQSSKEHELIRASERLYADMCAAWVRFLLTAGPGRVTDLRREVHDYLRGTEYLERAGDLLGVVEYRVGGERWWRLPADS